MNKMNPKVDGYLKRIKQWQQEMEMLRKIALDSKLTEDMKWGHPCYTLDQKNVVLMHGFKEYCALLFFKGALLKDTKGILVQQTENVQAGRQIRFTNTQDIVKLKPILKAYIAEAIKVEEAGLKVVFKEPAKSIIPVEFQTQLDKNSALKAAFSALTPGRQRGYILYFSGAKQSKTREARVEKYMKQILAGKGLDD
jgi:uncharacterized protein YdeI (YjbR/CyaY-like superfamily)